MMGKIEIAADDKPMSHFLDKLTWPFRAYLAFARRLERQKALNIQQGICITCTEYPAREGATECPMCLEDRHVV